MLRFKGMTRDDWKREIAMQQGMAFGVDAYNDAMGYECEPWESDEEEDDGDYEDLYGEDEPDMDFYEEP